LIFYRFVFFISFIFYSFQAFAFVKGPYKGPSNERLIFDSTEFETEILAQQINRRIDVRANILQATQNLIEFLPIEYLHPITLSVKILSECADEINKLEMHIVRTSSSSTDPQIFKPSSIHRPQGSIYKTVTFDLNKDTRWKRLWHPSKRNKWILIVKTCEGQNVDVRVSGYELLVKDMKHN